VHLKNVPNLVSTCLVLHNMCIIFCNNFWKNEWMWEATDEIHNELAIESVPGVSMQEMLVVANWALNNLTDIDDSRETLEYIKQEAAMKFDIAMGNGGKTFKELAARRNIIAKKNWIAKTKNMYCTNFHFE
jgi:hypothetical protein